MSLSGEDVHNLNWFVNLGTSWWTSDKLLFWRTYYLPIFDVTVLNSFRVRLIFIITLRRFIGLRLFKTGFLVTFNRVEIQVAAISTHYTQPWPIFVKLESSYLITFTKRTFDHKVFGVLKRVVFYPDNLLAFRVYICQHQGFFNRFENAATHSWNTGLYNLKKVPWVGFVYIYWFLETYDCVARLH